MTPGPRPGRRRYEGAEIGKWAGSSASALFRDPLGNVLAMRFGTGLPAWVRALSRNLTLFVLSGVIYYAWWDHIRPPFTGDEPHYLAYGQAIGVDHTLNVGPVYSSKIFQSLAPGITAIGHAFDYRHNGILRSVHEPGLALLLAPVLAVSENTLVVRTEMIIIAALLAVSLYGLLRDVLPRAPRWVIWITWGISAFTFPLLSYSNELYPEVPATLLCVVAVRILIRRWGRRGWAALASLLAGLLPWLHVRFGFFALVLVAVACTSCLAPSGPSHGSRRQRRWRWWPAVVPAAVLLALLGVLFHHLYGSFLPSAPYHNGETQIPPQSLRQTYLVGIGSLLSPSSGILPFGPFLILGVIGLGVVAARFRPWGPVAVGSGLVYALLIVPFGPFGYCLPGRYDLVLVPLLAVGTASLLDSFHRLWMPAAALAGGSVAVALLNVNQPNYGNLYDTGLVRTMRPVIWLWPDFDSPALGGTVWRSALWLGCLGAAAVVAGWAWSCQRSPRSTARRRYERPRPPGITGPGGSSDEPAAPEVSVPLRVPLHT